MSAEQNRTLPLWVLRRQRPAFEEGQGTTAQVEMRPPAGMMRLQGQPNRVTIEMGCGRDVLRPQTDDSNSNVHDRFLRFNQKDGGA